MPFVVSRTMRIAVPGSIDARTDPSSLTSPTALAAGHDARGTP
jgi:hypothetical protein